ncbi:putative conserved protein, contains HEPN domain [Candidatus Methanophagaceae archaeon]|jgi:uncharacterized protein with HEPN domain|nr:putative conserved protein, contains HEPN domain [Methanophagales archaeon]
MQRDKGHLLDILEAAEIALTYVRGMCRDDFLDDLQCQDAVIRRLEIIGEAARRTSGKTQNTFPDLPWSDMIGMRNMMIHEYDGVDLYIVWETVNTDLPPLIEVIKGILQTLE